MQRPKMNRRAAIAAAGAGILAGAGLVVTLGPGVSGASSHREAPLTAADPQADNTDVYAFTSPDKPGTVTLLGNWLPFQEPNGGPNFYPFATNTRYNIKIDNNGDAYADVIYRWTFINEDKRGNSTFLYNNGPVKSLGDPTLLFKQRYTLEEITPRRTRVLVRNAIAAPSNTGPASMPDYAALRKQAVRALPGGYTSFAGQSEDPFFADLRVFDLLYGANLSETGKDTLRGYNVNTLGLQVPKTALAYKGSVTRNPVVGIWSTTERRGADRKFRQVSRLGNPLVNEAVAPAGLKDAFNRLAPHQDAKVAPLVARVTKPEIPQLIEKIYGIKAPATPRNDLVEIFLTGISTKSGPIKADLNSQLLNKDVNPKRFTPAEMLRLNLAIAPAAQPNRLGVLAGDFQGFPNGRRLTDDVIDIAIQALEGAAQSGQLVAALAAGDGVDTNEKPFGTTFPYVALPHNASVNQAG